MSNIQTTFARHLQKGLPGQLARANAPYDYDLGVAGVEVKPGQGVYFDGTSKFILPTSDVTRKLVTHVVCFDPTSFNTDIGAPTTNNISEVVFAADAIIKLASFGSFFVQVGETVKSSDALIYNQATGKWIVYTDNDIRPVPFIAYLDPLKTASDGDIVEVKVTSANFVAGNLGTVTSVVTLTAAQIKLLRATPIEVIPAPGAGKVIEFVSAILKLNYGSEGFTESADNLVLEYDGGSAAVCSQVIEATGFIDQTADTQTNALPVVDTIDASADIENKNIAIFNNGDGEIAGNASDDSTIDVHITYRVHTM